MKLFRVLLPVVAVAALASCATPAPAQRQEMSFTNMPRINLDVAAVEVVDEYKPTLVSPHVDHLAVPTPSAAIHRWASDRLVADGASGYVRLTIKDASIVEQDLPLKGGVEGFFTKQQAQRYTGRIEVEVIAENRDRNTFGNGQVVVEHSTTVPEDISVAGREAAWDKLVRDMMADANKGLESVIREKLSAVVR